MIDLCSGGGGPWLWLRGELAREECAGLEITLTDRYPNLAAFRLAQEASGGAIGFCAESIDAQKIPPALSGFRTIFSSVHHFPQDEVVAMLRSAVERGEGIGFFEAAKRRPRTILYAFVMPVAAILLVPFMKEFRFARLVWTYLLPVIPFVLLFDGVLSCLRAYTPDELREMASRAATTNYTWDIGEARAVTYLLGRPCCDSGDDQLVY